MRPKVILGADHGGFEAKNNLKDWLAEFNFQVEDLGAHKLDKKDDYPAIAFAVGKAVSESKESVIGVLLCRTGEGMTIAANKVVGIRASLATSLDATMLARKHNHANVLTLSADWMDEDEMKAHISLFAETSWSKEERHVRRVAAISAYESSR